MRVRMMRAGLVVATAISVTGCATPDPYAERNKKGMEDLRHISYVEGSNVRLVRLMPGFVGQSVAANSRGEPSDWHGSEHDCQRAG